MKEGSCENDKVVITPWPGSSQEYRLRIRMTNPSRYRDYMLPREMLEKLTSEEEMNGKSTALREWRPDIADTLVEAGLATEDLAAVCGAYIKARN